MKPRHKGRKTQPGSGAWSLSRTSGPSFRPLARSIAFWAVTALPPIVVLILLAVDRHLLESPPDMILLDIRLPEIDGLQVLNTLRRNPRTTKAPVTAVSAHARRGDIDRGLNAGFLRYLTKPFLISALTDSITLALRQDKSTT